jgi:hypothetical protein
MFKPLWTVLEVLNLGNDWSIDLLELCTDCFDLKEWGFACFHAVNQGFMDSPLS